MHDQQQRQHEQQLVDSAEDVPDTQHQVAPRDLSCAQSDHDTPQLPAQPALVRLGGRTPSPAALRFLQLLHENEVELLTDDAAPWAGTTPRQQNA